jgi:hypothetical protein
VLDLHHLVYCHSAKAALASYGLAGLLLSFLRWAALRPRLELQLDSWGVHPGRQGLQQLHPLLQQRCQAAPALLQALLPGLLRLAQVFRLLLVGLLLLLAAGCRALLWALALGRCCRLGQKPPVQRPARVGRLQGGRMMSQPRGRLPSARHRQRGACS